MKKYLSKILIVRRDDVRRVLAILLSVSILFLTTNIVYAADSCSDWAIESIYKAEEIGLISQANHYQYKEPMTREEFCVIIYNYINNILGLKDLNRGNYVIADTNSKAVKQLVYRGIISGKNIELQSIPPVLGERTEMVIERVTFAPNDFLTREEAAVILVRLLAITVDVPVVSNYNEFVDRDEISDWAYSSIQAMYKMGMMSGIGGNKFAPKDILTAEQAIATIMRICNDKQLSSQNMAE